MDLTQFTHLLIHLGYLYFSYYKYNCYEHSCESLCVNTCFHFSWIDTLALKMNLIQIVRDHWVHILVPMGFVVGCYLDRKNDEKLTAFRNKSVLFKRLDCAFF